MRAIDLAAALALMDEDGTHVDGCIELPYPLASPELSAQVGRLGVTLSAEPSQPECVFEVLRWCMVQRRDVTIVYHTDVDGKPWRVAVEPHGFRRSKEGLRLRCYVPEQENEPDVVCDYQTAGWHLYLIEDIEWAEAGRRTVEPRRYRSGTDEPLLSIVFQAPAQTE